MKVFFILAFVCALAWAQSFQDDEYAFNIFDSKWDNVEGSIENMSLEEIVAAIRSASDETEFQQLADTLSKLGEIANSIDTEKVSPHPDAFRTVCEIVIDKGYPCEEHQIKTEDGFFLNFFRIPHGINSTIVGPPVLLSHGLFDTSGSWVINYPESSLGYLFADAGFDVWLGNIRGNKYGDTHETYGRYSKELWAHSFDQHGRYDIPDTLDYIISNSNSTRVGIVGHSQGCAQLFSTMEQRPETANKVSIFGALAPAGYMEYQQNLLIKFAAGFRLGELLQFLGVKKAFPLPEFIIDLLPYICDAAPELVEFLLTLIFGPNRGEWDYSRTAVMCAQSLGFTSMQNLVHWAQLVRSKKFRFYDYGWWENRKQYGQGSPPTYRIKDTWPADIPVAVYYGGNDDLSPQRDVETIISDLPRPPVKVKFVERYSHEDFIWAITAADEVYHDVINVFKEHYNME